MDEKQQQRVRKARWTVAAGWYLLGSAAVLFLVMYLVGLVDFQSEQTVDSVRHNISLIIYIFWTSLVVGLLSLGLSFQAWWMVRKITGGFRALWTDLLLAVIGGLLAVVLAGWLLFQLDDQRKNLADLERDLRLQQLWREL